MYSYTWFGTWKSNSNLCAIGLSFSLPSTCICIASVAVHVYVSWGVWLSFHQVKGVLKGGIAGYKEAGLPLESFQRVDLVREWKKLIFVLPCFLSLCTLSSPYPLHSLSPSSPPAYLESAWKLPQWPSLLWTQTAWCSDGGRIPEQYSHFSSQHATSQPTCSATTTRQVCC